MEWYYFLIIAVLVLFSAFFSGADMVYGSVDVDKLKKEADKGSKQAKTAYNLAINYENTISTILFANNLVNILASSIVALIGASINENNGPAIGALIFTGVIIIFGEFFPKAIAKRFNYSLSKKLSFVIKFFCYLFCFITWPIAKIFQGLSILFTKKVKQETDGEGILDNMINDIEQIGELDTHEVNLVRGAIDLSDIEAFEIMTPRVDVFAIDVNDDLNEIIKEKKIFDYSRVPVYEGTIDNIIGILYVKFLCRKIVLNEEMNLREMLLKPVLIPRNTQILDLLDNFKKTQMHIAIVIDEYGGVEGIVTMEDILEEVVGDIFDETDEIEEEFVKKDKNTWIVDGLMNIEDFFELIGYKGDFETAYSTVGGLCQEFKEGFLKQGDSFKFDNFKITVIEADQLTVQKVKVKRLKK